MRSDRESVVRQYHSGNKSKFFDKFDALLGLFCSIIQSYFPIPQVHAETANVYCPLCVAMGCCKGTKNASVLTEPLVGNILLVGLVCDRD